MPALNSWLPWSLVGCALLFICPLARAAEASYQPDIAPSQAQASIVLVEGAEYGTAFTMLHRGNASYFLTSAHLLNMDAYQRNAALPQTDAKKTAAEWLTVYDPYDGQAYAAEIIGQPDFEDDVIALRVIGMHHRPRPLCLADSLPVMPPFAIASFELHVLQDAPSGRPFARDVFKSDGTSSTPPLPDSNEFQYAAALEKGFSGGPIFDVESGAVFGIVRRSPYVVDPNTGKWIVSQETRQGVSIDAIRGYLARLAAADAVLHDHPSIAENDRTKLVPKLTGALRLIAFDDPRGGANLSFVYRAYDAQIRDLIGTRFRHSNGSAFIDPDTAVYKIKTRTTSIPHICRMSNNEEASGVVALRREMSAGPGPRTLEARIALLSCAGRVIDSADIPASQLDGKGPSYAQIKAFVGNLGQALDTLAAGNDQRLANFAADGLPLADSELRGFYQVRHEQDATFISYSWAGGAALTASHLRDERRVLSIAGLTDTQLRTISSGALDSFLDRAGGSAPAAVVQPDGSTSTVTLGTADRCAYLWRRKNVGEPFPGTGKDEVL